MSKLSVSVLSADFSKLGADCREVLDAGADMIHFDVMDGHFVDNLSFGLPVLKSLRKALPDAYFDVHLMITSPLEFIMEFVEAGANCITFHVEASNSIRCTVAAIKAFGCDVGLAVNPNTPVEAVFPFLYDLTIILVMSVKPGHAGQKFHPQTPIKLRKLKAECVKRGIDPLISVDGGIKIENTAPLCIDSGANLLVAGSAIFDAPDRVEAVHAFKALKKN